MQLTSEPNEGTPEKSDYRKLQVLQASKFPITPFFIQRYVAASRVGLMLFPERSSFTNDG
jgi:hypothetical protein